MANKIRLSLHSMALAMSERWQMLGPNFTKFREGTHGCAPREEKLLRGASVRYNVPLVSNGEVAERLKAAVC
jgi:hypothetical protein